MPVLGICYGAQLMAHELGGDVVPASRREYGPATVAITAEDGLFARPRARAAGLDEPRRLDPQAAGRLRATGPDGLDALSPASPTTSRRLYGIQFHPEVVHTPRGRDILRNFVSASPDAQRDVDAGELHRLDRRRDPCPRRAHAREPARWPGHLRAVGRRRLGGRGDARPSRRRRPADVHLRRPRPDAQARVGAAARDVRGATWACAW